jgi:hypothetical protein
MKFEDLNTSILKGSEPTPSLHGCVHSWELKHQGDTFSLICPWCHATIKAWRHLPRVLSNVLDAAVKLEPVYCAGEDGRKRWYVREAHLRAAVSLLNLPSRSRCERSRIWDVYATLYTLFSLKSGGPRGNLIFKSRTLNKLIEAAMYPSRLKTMPVSSRKRHKFVLDAIMMLPARLSRDSLSFS